MARFEILDSTAAPLGAGPAAGDMLFELGMMYSVGRDMPLDLVAAHKWFNLAAMKGNVEAIRLRREIASQMSEADIATAQRAARDWLRGNQDTSAPAMAETASIASNSLRPISRAVISCCPAAKSKCHFPAESLVSGMGNA